MTAMDEASDSSSLESSPRASTADALDLVGDFLLVGEPRCLALDVSVSTSEAARLPLLDLVGDLEGVTGALFRGLVMLPVPFFLWSSSGAPSSLTSMIGLPELRELRGASSMAEEMGVEGRLVVTARLVGEEEGRFRDVVVDVVSFLLGVLRGCNFATMEERAVEVER